MSLRRLGLPLAGFAGFALVAACSTSSGGGNSAPSPSAAPATPAVVAAPPPGGPTTATVPFVASPLATVIVNGAQYSPTTTQTTFKLQFSATGGTNSVTINDFRFYCQRETDSAFSVCPDNDFYTFSGLQKGSSYSLTVQAVSLSSGLAAAPTTLRFQVSQ